MRAIRPFFVIAFSVITLTSLYNYYFNDKFARGGWDKVCQYIEENSGKESAILFPSFIPIPFNYYYKGQIPFEAIDKSNCIKKAAEYKQLFLISYLDKFSDPGKEIYSRLKSISSKAEEAKYSDIRIHKCTLR